MIPTNIFATITERKEIAKGTIEFTLGTSDMLEIQAGQFCNVKVPNCDSLILKRPFCAYSVTENSFKIGFATKGKGTKQLAKAQVGDTLEVLLPLGRGFDIESYEKVLLVGGGVGVLPLLSVAEKLKSTDACLGFRSEVDIMKLDDFKQNCGVVDVSTDDGSFGHKGFVVEIVKKYLEKNQPDAIFACGPMVMLKSLAAVADKTKIFVSLEERMGCGIGACLVCSCKTKVRGEENYSRVCSDGPVFAFEEVFYA